MILTSLVQQPHITTSNRIPEPDLLPTVFQDCFLSLLILICLKLAICALNWSMGMVGAGANFFNFSLSIGLKFDTLNACQILKLDGLYFGTSR